MMAITFHPTIKAYLRECSLVAYKNLFRLVPSLMIVYDAKSCAKESHDKCIFFFATFVLHN